MAEVKQREDNCLFICAELTRIINTSDCGTLRKTNLQVAHLVKTSSVQRLPVHESHPNDLFPANKPSNTLKTRT